MVSNLSVEKPILLIIAIQVHCHDHVPWIRLGLADNADVLTANKSLQIQLILLSHPHTSSLVIVCSTRFPHRPLSTYQTRFLICMSVDSPDRQDLDRLNVATTNGPSWSVRYQYELTLSYQQSTVWEIRLKAAIVPQGWQNGGSHKGRCLKGNTTLGTVSLRRCNKGHPYPIGDR